MVLGWIGLGWIMRGCKKVQKKCKKMQYLLHISKKSSIFAPELGIVPSITLKQIKDMNKKCIFRCQSNGVVFRVIQEPFSEEVDCVRYVVYEGRKKAKCPWWYNREYAIETAIELCLGAEWIQVKEVSL